VAQAAAADHGHHRAAGGQQRGEHQAHRVADAAGGVLVEHRAGQVQALPRQHLAGMRHRPRERHGLVAVHAAQHDGHGQGRGLALAPAAVDEAAHEALDLCRAQRAPVALGADGLLRQFHGQAAFS
jgi:hypothetical protein